MSLLSKYRKLEAENKQLKMDLLIYKKRVLDYKQKYEFLKTNPSIAKGIKGEFLISNIIGGAKSDMFSDFDVQAGVGGKRIKLEVKYASATRTGPQTETLRWVWVKIYGESGKKNFNRMILVGEKDERYKDYYLDRDSPYVFFDIPYAKLSAYCLKVGPANRKWVGIMLTTNPKTVRSNRSKAAPLFVKHQVTMDILRKRYSVFIK